MDADKLEAMIAAAVTQYADASPADRPAIAEAAAGAISALLGALDEQDKEEGVRQLAALLIAARALGGKEREGVKTPPTRLVTAPRAWPINPPREGE